MKTWVSKIRGILRSDRGESIMEAVASMLILAILLATITSMIQTSLKWTGIYLQESRAMQDIINPVRLGVYGVYSETVEISFKADVTKVEASHNVDFYDNNGIIAFSPRNDTEVYVP
jgi:hypothetical protein